MNSHPDYEAALKQTIRAGLAIVVVGTGVSIAASCDAKSKKPHPQASWTGLLENGLQWLQDHHVMDEEVAQAQLTLLRKRPQTHRLISAAADITEGMSAKHFADWLASTVGTIKAQNLDVLDALSALRMQGNLLATTNYDGLLLGTDRQLSPVIWVDSDELIAAARSRDTSKIIFLHGYWRRPETVILDWRSYDRIVRDEQYREDFAAFWKTSIWVYVGCGVNGVSDPDFGLLLERYGERARQAGHWDYCLVREDQRNEFQAEFDSKSLNIRAISFGKNHSDLPAYLRSLLPAPVLPSAPEYPDAVTVSNAQSDSTIPCPPAFYAAPEYIGSHAFIGRKEQLRMLSEWAQPSDPSSVLLFESIGGNGKSMLTWEWAKSEKGTYATHVREWAGRFWYSFYEKGAVMRTFCEHALAYITQQPLAAFERKTTAEMRVELLALLRRQPWLLILDGLERVLVAYHRIDGVEVPDEEMNRPTDKILTRNPCDAIRDEDNDLLRALSTAAPSKILISSRLIPRVLLNHAGIPLPGVKLLVLPGLEEADAEELLRSSGNIQGASADIRYYLTTYCANHPLAIGVIAGLINSPGPHRGNFDGWAADSEYGAKLNLANLDLVQSRNHILRAAMDALEPASRQLLSTLALLSYAVDYETLVALNPYLPPEPTEVAWPELPEQHWRWESRTAAEKAYLRHQYELALTERKAYEQAIRAWRDSEAVREATRKLSQIIQDLEQRGLLQYDAQRRYDLHPVVRGVAARGMQAEDMEQQGQRVVDYYSSRFHDPYEQARTIEELENGLQVVRILLKLGRYQQAVDAYRGDLSSALSFNLEAHVEELSLLRPFFLTAWDRLVEDVDDSDAAFLADSVGGALGYCGEYQKAAAAYEVAIRIDLESEDWSGVAVSVNNISRDLSDQGLLAKALRLDRIGLDLANAVGEDEEIFINRFCLFEDYVRCGQWEKAEESWRLLGSMKGRWSRLTIRQGTVEGSFAEFQFFQGTLREDHIATAEALAEKDCNRLTVRNLHRLRGSWRLELGEWAQAAASFSRAVTMARERRFVDESSETALAVAKHHLQQLTGADARREAERLSQLQHPAHYYLALLWQAVGDLDQARHHAIAAYKEAWGDGEPYVERYELTEATELLNELGAPIPNLPPYDPAKDEPFPWEADVRAAIERLRAKKTSP